VFCKSLKRLKVEYPLLLVTVVVGIAVCSDNRNIFIFGDHFAIDSRFKADFIRAKLSKHSEAPSALSGVKDSITQIFVFPRKSFPKVAQNLPCSMLCRLPSK